VIVLFYIFGAVTLLSLGLQVWQWLAARRLPLHQPVPVAGSLPPVTLLKPLKGCDDHTAACLRSWLAQDYPAPVQILFGVNAADDPVCEVVRELLKEFPDADAQLVVCPESRGPNPKVSTLIQLEPLIGGTPGKATFQSPQAGPAQPDTVDRAVVISDADVEVPPGYLKEAMSILQRDGVGLVNSFYRLANPRNRAMWIEAVAVNCDFWSQVCQSNSMRPMTFVLGAVMGLRAQTLSEIGGFQSLADYLADDNRLGLLVHRTGQSIELTNTVVDCHSAPMTFRQVWDHQLRWARTIRVCEPLPYFFSILTNALVWSLLWLACSISFGLRWPLYAAMGGLLVYAALRFATATANGRKLTTGRMSAWKIAQVLDIRDALGVLWWLCAFLGNTIVWRGRRHRILSEGRLESLDEPD
jgi:ceramide glucosyltransferase